jgi:hydrogenase maturation protease
MSLSSTAPHTNCHPRGDNHGDTAETICVLGIGNVLWADEGFGVRCLEALQERYAFAPHVSLIDGGTQGLYLIQFVQSADKLIIFDAIDYGLAPGTLKLVRNDDVPRFMGAKKMSLHQTGFQEVLSLAQLTGRFPKEVLLIGCQPEELEDYGGSLRPVVKQALEQALDVGIQTLQDWGACPQRRAASETSNARGPSLDALALAAYESQRPSPEQACRAGDARFFPTTQED